MVLKTPGKLFLGFCFFFSFLLKTGGPLPTEAEMRGQVAVELARHGGGWMLMTCSKDAQWSRSVACGGRQNRGVIGMGLRGRDNWSGGGGNAGNNRVGGSR